MDNVPTIVPKTLKLTKPKKRSTANSSGLNREILSFAESEGNEEDIHDDNDEPNEPLEDRNSGKE